uniref:NID domain-containing protein n=1 Tax=Malurus cyaneus samueli TaxID=2593467 RepID=A0A8C5U1R4_9PASS
MEDTGIKNNHILFHLSILKSQIKKNVAEMQLKFTHLADMKEHWADMDTQCVFGATTKIPFKLNQNQALLTFEDEKVAQRLTRMSKHSVNLDNRTANVTVRPFELEIGFQFQPYCGVSKRTILLKGIPELEEQPEGSGDARLVLRRPGESYFPSRNIFPFLLSSLKKKSFSGFALSYLLPPLGAEMIWPQKS